MIYSKNQFRLIMKQANSYQIIINILISIKTNLSTLKILIMICVVNLMMNNLFIAFIKIKILIKMKIKVNIFHKM